MYTTLNNIHLYYIRTIPSISRNTNLLFLYSYYNPPANYTFKKNTNVTTINIKK